jgi:hypothetical protein
MECCEQVINEKPLRGAKVSEQRSRHKLRAQNNSLLRSNTSSFFRKRVLGRDRSGGEGVASSRAMVDRLRPSQPHGHRVLVRVGVRMEGVCVERQSNVFAKILAHPGGISQSMAARLWGRSVLIRPLHFQLDLPAFEGEMSTAQDDMVQGVRTAAEGADVCVLLEIELFFCQWGPRSRQG